MITFRGYSLQHNRWFYGPLSEDKVKAKIYSEELAQWFLVEPQSVGMLTPETDCDGKPIYTGDIVRCYPEPDWDLPHHNGEYRQIGDVIWNPADMQIQVRRWHGYNHGLPLRWGGWQKKQVIGNVTETPDFKPCILPLVDTIL